MGTCSREGGVFFGGDAKEGCGRMTQKKTCLFSYETPEMKKCCSKLTNFSCVLQLILSLAFRRGWKLNCPTSQQQRPPPARWYHQGVLSDKFFLHLGGRRVLNGKRKTWKVSERKDHAHMAYLHLWFCFFCRMICLLSILISHHCRNNWLCVFSGWDLVVSVVTFRKHFLLPIDVCFYNLVTYIPYTISSFKKKDGATIIHLPHVFPLNRERTPIRETFFASWFILTIPLSTNQASNSSYARTVKVACLHCWLDATIFVPCCWRPTTHERSGGTWCTFCVFSSA